MFDFGSFNIIFTVVMIFSLLIFGVVFAMILSSKLRSKMMKHQIKATKYMMEDSKEELSDIAAVSSNIAIKSRKKVLDENEELLTEMATRNASINKEGVEITARAIKKGLSKQVVHCKYCGKEIDDDSVFCKFCGKNLN